MSRRCTRCWSRKCDGGPFCARNRPSRGNRAAVLRERGKQGVCRNGHTYFKGDGCPSCRNQGELRRKAERRALEARPTPPEQPKVKPRIVPQPAYALKPEQLEAEREASKARSAARFQEALERCKRRERDEDALPIHVARRNARQRAHQLPSENEQSDERAA